MQLFQPNLVNKACNIWSYELHQPKLPDFPSSKWLYSWRSGQM